MGRWFLLYGMVLAIVASMGYSGIVVASRLGFWNYTCKIHTIYKRVAISMPGMILAYMYKYVHNATL